MTQPEALRLADSLWALMSTVYSNGTLEASAAELRRLHAELERCKQVCAATSESWRTDAEKWKAQRDALLEALQDLCDEQEGPPLVRRHRQWQAAIDKARAAIAKTEEKT